MRFQPNRDYLSNDDIQTPVELAGRIVRYFNPLGRILEPCAGDGHFLQHLLGADWCEIKHGRDFLSYEGRADWIITNPPWSQIRPFLQRSFRVADQVVFLMTINHAWTKARPRIARENGFALRTLLLVDTPIRFLKADSNWVRCITKRGGLGRWSWSTRVRNRLPDSVSAQ